MAVDVTPVFAAYFARNRGPVPGDPESRQAPDYGVSARLGGPVIDLALTFRAGAAYCCYEPGCHLDLFDGRRWEGLRRDLSAAGLTPPPVLELRLGVVIEAEALFFDYSRPEPSRRGRGWYAFAPAVARRFERVVREGVAADAEPAAAADAAPKAGPRR